jgi:predicted dienelactone hydrolase
VRKFVTSLLVAVSANCQAGMAWDTLEFPKLAGPVTIFYPTDAAQTIIQRGPFSFSAAMQGKPSKGNSRLVVFSHGSGGSPWPLLDWAQMLVDAGYVVAIPEHEGDNWRDKHLQGPSTWKLRPHEVSATIDAVQHDQRFAQNLDFNHVGVYGTSAGGHTALTMAGGRWSSANFMRHCLANIQDDFHACVGLITKLKGNFLDTVKLGVARLVHRLLFSDGTGQSHEDLRVTAVIASVPMAAPFDLASLASPRAAVAIVQAQGDLWLAPRFHSQPVLAACKPCTGIPNLAHAGHGTLFSPWPEPLAASISPMLVDPQGFDRTALPSVYQAMRSFFDTQLFRAQ